MSGRPDIALGALPNDFPPSSQGGRDHGGGPVARPAAVALSEQILFLLTLIARHDGRTPQAVLSRLIVERAEMIGLSGLLMNVLTPHGAARLAPANGTEERASARADDGRSALRAAPDDRAIHHAADNAGAAAGRHANSGAGDLHGVPEFERAAPNRFRRDRTIVMRHSAINVGGAGAAEAADRTPRLMARPAGAAAGEASGARREAESSPPAPSRPLAGGSRLDTSPPEGGEDGVEAAFARSTGEAEAADRTPRLMARPAGAAASEASGARREAES